MPTRAASDNTHEILIVEDDETAAAAISDLLETAGYTPVVVPDGETALARLSTHPPDLVLLDMRKDGIEVLRQVRQTNETPVIAINGDSETVTPARALNAGADDAIAKPYSGEVLVARVKAVLRRASTAQMQEARVVVRQLELDITRRQAYLRDRRLHLTPIEYNILLALMRSPGTVLSHEEMIRQVWGSEYNGDYSVLRVNVSRLRQKLEENPRHPTYIVTVAGKGYTMPERRS